MPKSTNAHGATYAGHVDVTPPGVTPQWEQLALFEVPRETSPSTTVGEAVDAPRKPGRPKGSRNKTTASAGNAAGSGSTGLA
jgi:hypothetical protein